jgi:hypothetical protein
MVLPIVSMSVTHYVCVPAINLNVHGNASAGLGLASDAHYSSVTSFDLRGSWVKLPLKYHSSCSVFSMWEHCIPLGENVDEDAVTSGKLEAGFEPGGWKLCCGQ